MQHVKTPDEQGWYWVENDGEWSMVYLDTSRDELRLLVADTDHHDLIECHEADDGWTADGLWVESYSRWIGPLECPGGPFHSAIHEFDAEQHDAAKADGKVLVALVVDFTYADSPQGQLIASGQMTVDEAWDAIKKTFPKSGGAEATAG